MAKPNQKLYQVTYGSLIKNGTEYTVNSSDAVALTDEQYKMYCLEGVQFKEVKEKTVKPVTA